MFRKRIAVLRLREFLFYQQVRLAKALGKIALFVSLIAFLAVVYDFGFYTSETWKGFSSQLFGLLFSFFAIVYLLRLFLLRHLGRHYLLKLVEFLIFAVLILAADFRLLDDYLLLKTLPVLSWLDSAFFTHALVIVVFVIELSQGSISLYKIRFNPSLLYAGSFFFLILFGTGLLLLPKASHQEISLIDALFTATSAACVTGLIVVDTATHFSLLGQSSILLLFQLGGLGVMVFTGFFGFFFQGSPSFQNQIFLKDFINEDRLGKVFKTLLKILMFTLIVESLGTLLVYLFMLPAGHGFSQTLWFAFFHTVSAFCNAGFSLFTDGLYDAGMGVRHLYNLHLVIAVLIILGGIGFPVVFNFYLYLKYLVSNAWNKWYRGRRVDHLPRVINVNTRLVIVATFWLIVCGTILVWLVERDGVLAPLNGYAQWVSSFFMAVTARTAGFNTVDMSVLAVPAVLIVIFLMWVGASPSSAGGGIKTTTFAVAVLNAWAMAQGKERVEVYRREIHPDSSRRAFTVIFLSLMIIGAAITCIAYLDPQLPLKAIAFECFSAFSTVGLSLGITAGLSDGSKLVLILLMFIGRIGTITLLIAFFRKVSSSMYRFPSEQIFIN